MDSTTPMTWRVITYSGSMSRWQPDARDRLERAALELFTEQGFAETTVPQITARAGLTTRTFFRHFADKREVLFAGEADLPALITGFLAAAPPDRSPMRVVVDGLPAVAPALFGDRRDYLRQRRAVVASDAGLQERELRKLATLSEAIADGLQSRGADELTAKLAAGFAVLVVNVSVTRWLEQTGDTALTAMVTETLTTLRAMTGEALT
jgi:AcrR family transcriptional regulator